MTCAWSSRAVRAGLVVTIAAACTAPPALDAREQRIVAALHDDNYVWAARDRRLVELKLVKMQRDPYAWLRGTASLYWRDVTERGGGRPATAFGDPRASRVLLVGDPHPENVGTFRAGDGTMFVDWNDFDGTGYGPFTLDLRRLGAGLAIAAGDDAIAGELVRRAAAAYAARIAELAAGARIGPLTAGAHPLLDAELATARTRGDRRHALAQVAPVVAGARALAFGDLEDVAADGVIEDRLVPVSAEVAGWLDRAIASWRAGIAGGDELGAVVLRARRIGAGVASYPALRYVVVLAGPTDAPDDDRLIELKETREGFLVPGVPRLAAAEWASPAARAADTQRRLQARDDGDPLLGHALVGGLALKLRDREAYQRGLDHEDLAALAAGGAAPRAQLAELAALLGGLLARAHGQATTEDGVPGWTVIAPLLAGREAAFADEIERHALADAAQIAGDHARMKDRALAPLVLAEVAP